MVLIDWCGNTTHSTFEYAWGQSSSCVWAPIPSFLRGILTSPVQSFLQQQPEPPAQLQPAEAHRQRLLSNPTATHGTLHKEQGIPSPLSVCMNTHLTFSTPLYFPPNPETLRASIYLMWPSYLSRGILRLSQDHPELCIVNLYRCSAVKNKTTEQRNVFLLDYKQIVYTSPVLN